MSNMLPLRAQLVLAATLFTSFTALPSQKSFAAGGHFVVDDADITEPGRCQVEAWYARSDRGNDEITLMPACNPTGNLVITLGISRIQEDRQRDSITELGLKSPITALQSDRVAMAIAVAGFRSHEQRRVTGGEALVPVSVTLNDQLTTHLNLGWGWERDDDDAALWGAGLDLALLPRLNLIAETYGSHRGGTRIGSGLRFALDEGIDLDLGWDLSRRDSDDDAVIAGIAIAF